MTIAKKTAFLPPASEGWGKVMFSQVCGREGYPKPGQGTPSSPLSCQERGTPPCSSSSQDQDGCVARAVSLLRLGRRTFLCDCNYTESLFGYDKLSLTVCKNFLNRKFMTLISSNLIACITLMNKVYFDL